MPDSAYRRISWKLSEMPHAYGPRVHLVGDPVSLSLLGRVCAPQTTQPAFNRLIGKLYTGLVRTVVNREFPRVTRRIPTRMAEQSDAGVLEGEFLDPATRVVCVDIARAGILPSAQCFDFCNELFDPAGVRQDHLIMSRQTDADGAVQGAGIHGDKIGGSIDGAYVLFPDPMGATGTSLATAIRYYLEHHGRKPARMVALHLIVTPQYLRRMSEEHPEVEIYALRLDRGRSAPEVLALGLGERWEAEDGLTDEDYIVPGGGGFGELMNNSWV